MLDAEALSSRAEDELSPAESLLEDLRSHLPNGGQRRLGQLEMARAVSRVIDQGGVLSVKAPTGTGKSLAYISALLVHRGDGPAVVATSSIALQDQIAGKDLPFVAEHSSRQIQWAVLKGRSNYLCRAALDSAVRAQAEGKLELFPDEGEAQALGLGDIVEWSRNTVTGDRAELTAEPSQKLWGEVSMTSEGCPGAAKCKFGPTCFAERAVGESRAADVIVVNTHLYGIHVKTDGNVLPEHDIVVVDEAHEMEGVFSSVLGTEVRPTQLSHVASLFSSVMQDDRVTSDLHSVATRMKQVLDEFPGDARLPDGVDGHPAMAEVAQAAAVAVVRARKALESIPEDTNEKVLGRLFRVRGAISSLLEALGGVSRPSSDVVVWVEAGRAIKSAPLEIASVLDRWFWRRANDPLSTWETGASPPRTVVLTSATLPPRTAASLGAAHPRHIAVESPFAHKENALLYVPRLPDPRREAEAWRRAVIDELASLIKEAGGRTLALFTSFAAMNEAALGVDARVTCPVLVQGQMPKRELLRRFALEEEACLFGTRSFFQGVDVPGRSLSVVAVDRLPFPRPDDPLVAARCEAAGDAGFAKVMVPLASTALAQAAGRLIRTSTDRGVVAVFDPRLAEAKYRSDILAALPPMRRTRERAAVEAFLAEILGEVRHVGISAA